MEGTGCQSGGGRVSGASRMHRMDKLTSQPVQRVSYRIIRGVAAKVADSSVFTTLANPSERSFCKPQREPRSSERFSVAHIH